MRSEEADTNVEICSGNLGGEDRRVTSHLEVANDGIRCEQFLQVWQKWLGRGNATVPACLEEHFC